VVVSAGALCSGAAPHIRSVPYSSETTVITFKGDGSLYDTGCNKISIRKFSIGKPTVFGQTFECRKASATGKLVALYVHGGPMLPAFRNQLNGEQYILLSRGYKLYEPAYYGDNDRRVTQIHNARFTNNISLAIEQIASVLAYLQRRHSEVLVYGDSFGGYLSSYVASRLRPSDRLVLFKAPLADAHTTWIKELPDGFVKPVGVDGAPAQEVQSQLREASHQLAESLFGPYMSRTVIQNLEHNKAGWTVVIAGERDRPSGPVYWPKLRKSLAGRGHFVLFKDAGHEGIRNTKERLQFTNAIWPGASSVR